MPKSVQTLFEVSQMGVITACKVPHDFDYADPELTHKYVGPEEAITLAIVFTQRALNTPTQWEKFPELRGRLKALQTGPDSVITEAEARVPA